MHIRCKEKLLYKVCWLFAHMRGRVNYFHMQFLCVEHTGDTSDTRKVKPVSAQICGNHDSLI